MRLPAVTGRKDHPRHSQVASIPRHGQQDGLSAAGTPGPKELGSVVEGGSDLRHCRRVIEVRIDQLRVDLGEE